MKSILLLTLAVFLIETCRLAAGVGTSPAPCTETLPSMRFHFCEEGGTPTPSQDKPAFAPESALPAVVNFRTDRDLVGHGFIVKRSSGGVDRFFLYTTQAAISRFKSAPKAYRGNGNELRLGRCFVSKSRDLVLFALESAEPHHLEVTSDLSKDSTIGGKVSSPQHVESRDVEVVEGEIAGNGPELVEIKSTLSNHFPGGPILNHEGKVLAVFSHWRSESKDDERIASDEDKIRRHFGYRVDNVKPDDWQLLDWERFSTQSLRYSKVSKLTTDLQELMDTELKSCNGNEELLKIVGEFKSGLQKAANEKNVYGRASEACVKLRDLCLVDINALAREDLYWFWRRGLDDHRRYRQNLRQHFDNKHKEFEQKRN